MTSSAQLLMFGHGHPSLDDDLRKLLERRPVGGIYLFGEALGSPRQVRALTAEIQALAPAGLPLFIAIDQEGGRFQAWGPPHQEPLPSAGQVGWDAEIAGERFEVTLMAMNVGRQLASAGINLDFAPVLDVAASSEEKNRDERRFGSCPELVADLGAAFVEGLQAAGVLACGKHFPGLGDGDQLRVDSLELAPFRAAIAAGLQTMKVAHALYPSWDPDRPATFSPEIVRALLREELGFEGVVFTEDLESEGRRDSWSLVEATLLSLEAGCDVVLSTAEPGRREELLDGLEHARREGRLKDERVRESVHRIVAVKQDWLSEA